MGQDDVMGKMQNFAYDSACTLVLPGLLLFSSAILLAYRNVTEEKNDLPLNGFLANIFLQMLPLMALKLKIWTCNDRVSLVPLVLCKTLMLHVVLTSLRGVSAMIIGVGKDERLPVAVDVVGLIGALALLKYEFEFPMNPLDWMKHQDVRNLIILACGGGFASHAFFIIVQPTWMSDLTREQSREFYLPFILFTCANYVDILAFMPIVWRLYQAEEYEESATGAAVQTGATRQVRAFFTYVVAFYAWDDVIDPIMTLTDEPLGMMAHAAHFVLLLDFAGFFTFQVGQASAAMSTSKDTGELSGLLARDDEDNC